MNKQTQIKVMFDSNVWERLVSLPIPISQKDDFALHSIYQKIIEGNILPFISDGVYVEAITKELRGQVLSAFVKTSYKMESVGNNFHLKILTNDAALPPLPKILIDKVDKAIKLGFKFISTHRIGFPHADLPLLYLVNDLKKFQLIEQRLEAAHDLLIKLDAGDCWINELSSNIFARNNLPSNTNWLRALEFANNIEKKKIPKAVAEWCDGDAVITCHAYGLDYLCTFDKGKGAGEKSVLSIKNREILKESLDLIILDPKELLGLFDNRGQ